jgi:hypothetical protein
MPVCIDKKLIESPKTEIKTVAQALSLARKHNRLIVRVRLDGREPTPRRVQSIRKCPIGKHLIEIDTIDPRQMAQQVLAEVEQELTEAHRLTSESSRLLQRNQVASAVEKLGGIFTTWQHVQESLFKTAQILRIDPQAIKVRGRAMTDLLKDFAIQLNQVRRALDVRDFNTLTDLLSQKLTQGVDQWRDAIGSFRLAICA